jgi:hypothetical protein
MDTYALAPDGRGGCTVRVRYQSGGIVYHLFETEAQAVTWIIEHKLQAEPGDFKPVSAYAKPHCSHRTN